MHLETQLPLDTDSAAQYLPPVALEAMGKYLASLQPGVKNNNAKLADAIAEIRKLKEVRDLKLPPEVIPQAVKNILEHGIQ